MLLYVATYTNMILGSFIERISLTEVQLMLVHNYNFVPHVTIASDIVSIFIKVQAY